MEASIPEQRIVEAAAVLPEIGGVTGWAGLRWAGGVWFDGRAPDGRPRDVDLATCYEDVRDRPGMQVCQERLPPSELVDHEGVRTTLPVRSLFFVLRRAPDLRTAVIAADMAAYSDLVSLDEAWTYAMAHPGWTGVPQARQALLLAAENSWSPRETALRLVWTLDAGMDEPLCNCPVFDLAGRLIGVPDLIDPESGLCGEYDGAVHLVGPQRARDLRRLDHLRDHGLEPVVVLADDMADRERVVRRLLAGDERARRTPAAERRWTLDPPPWWKPTHTVALRRALAAEDAARLLAHRRRTAA
ncbi:hypothetical protein [Nocardioides aurantiacus]|uniref:hypothetical protein n=1 Tax=Nocardioides aurantiacus TaxID=86796 RepID=UPI00403F1BD9